MDGRDSAMEGLKTLLAAYRVQVVRYQGLKIRTYAPDAATADFIVKTQLDKAPTAAHSLTKWHVKLVKSGDGRWLISQADFLEINGRAVLDLPFPIGL